MKSERRSRKHKKYSDSYSNDATVLVLTNFAIAPHLQACRKNSSNERSTFTFSITLTWFDEVFLILGNHYVNFKL